MTVTVNGFLRVPCADLSAALSLAIMLQNRGHQVRIGPSVLVRKGKSPASNQGDFESTEIPCICRKDG
jgi:hypothetical protein